MSAPATDAACIRPWQARTGRTARCLRADGSSPRDACQTTEIWRCEPVAIEARARPELVLRAEPASGVRGGRSQPSRSTDRRRCPAAVLVPDGGLLLTELPDASAGAVAVASSEMSETTVGLLQQKCGAGDRAATSTQPLSNTETETPSEANVSAMSAPVMPPPTMATSQLRCPRRVGYLRAGRWSSCSAHQTGWPRRRAAAFLIVAGRLLR